MSDEIIKGLSKLITGAITLTETASPDGTTRDVRWAKILAPELKKVTGLDLKPKGWRYDKKLSSKLKQDIHYFEFSNAGTVLRLVFGDGKFGYTCLGFSLGTPANPELIQEYKSSPKNNKDLINQVGRKFKENQAEVSKPALKLTPKQAYELDEYSVSMVRHDYGTDYGSFSKDMKTFYPNLKNIESLIDRLRFNYSADPDTALDNPAALRRSMRNVADKLDEIRKQYA